MAILVQAHEDLHHPLPPVAPHRMLRWVIETSDRTDDRPAANLCHKRPSFRGPGIHYCIFISESRQARVALGTSGQEPWPQKSDRKRKAGCKSRAITLANEQRQEIAAKRRPVGQEKADAPSPRSAAWSISCNEPRQRRVGKGGVGEKPSEGFAPAGPPPKSLISKALIVAAPLNADSGEKVAFWKNSKFIFKTLTRGSFRIQVHENKQSTSHHSERTILREAPKSEAQPRGCGKRSRESRIDA